MPPVVGVIVGAIVSAATAVGGAIAAFAGVVGWATALSIIGTGALLIISAFTRPSIAIDGPKVASQSPDAPRVIIYGQAMVGGSITYIAAVGNEATRLHMVVTLSGHECESIDEILFGNYKLKLTQGRDGYSGQLVYQEQDKYVGHVYVEYKLGAPGEPAFPALIAETAGLGGSPPRWQAGHAYSPGDVIKDPAGNAQVCITGGTSDSSPPAWNDLLQGQTAELPPSTVVWQCLGPGIALSAWTAAHRQDGCASVHLMIKYNQKLFSSGIPQLRFLVSGKKVYDPRSSTTAWSDNPALCIRDFLLDPKYGYRCFTSDNGVSSPEINDASFIAAANLADEGVGAGSPVTPLGPWPAVFEWPGPGYWDPVRQILYWMSSRTGAGETVVISSLTSGGVYAEVGCTIENILGEVDGRIAVDDSYFYIGDFSGGAGYRWHKVSRRSGLQVTDTKFVNGSDLGAFPSVCLCVGKLIHCQGSSFNIVDTETMIFEGSLSLTHGGQSICVAGDGPLVWVLDSDVGTIAIESVDISDPSSPVLNTYPLASDTLFPDDFDLEYYAGDNTLIVLYGMTLLKWDCATHATLASVATFYAGSGPVINGMVVNGLDFYDATTLEQLPLSGNGLNAGLPDLSSGIFFKHFYNPELGLVWVNARVSGQAQVWGAYVQETTIARYALDGAFDTTKTLGDVLTAMLSAGAGKVTWIAGQWNLFLGAWRAPTLPAFTDDDLRGPVQVQVKKGRRDIYTGVKGQYIEPQNNWMPTDFPPSVRSSYVARQNGTCETPNDRGDWAVGNTYAVNDTVMSFGYAYVCTVDNTATLATQPGLGAHWQDDWVFAGEIIWKDIQFPFTINGAMAQRLARIDLEWGQREITCAFPLKLQGYQAIPADVIQLTRPTFGWSAKTFEITAAKLVLASGELGVDLTLHETDENVFAWSTDDERPGTGRQTVSTGPDQVFDYGGDEWRLAPE